MARKLPQIRKLRQKTEKKEGHLDGREDKMLKDLMRLSAKYGLSSCSLPFELPEELRLEVSNRGYLVKDGRLSWAVIESVLVESETIEEIGDELSVATKCCPTDEKECCNTDEKECCNTDEKECCEGKCDPCECAK